MFSRIFILFLLILSIESKAVAEEIKRIAVLEFRGVGIEQPLLLKLSDQSRVAASEIFSQNEYLIITRESIQQILSDMGKDSSCMEGECELEIGRNIQADIIVTGDIINTEGTYFLTLKIYNTSTNVLLKAKNVESENFKELLHKTKTVSADILREGLNLKIPMHTVKFVTDPLYAHIELDGKLLCSSTPCTVSIKKGDHSIVFFAPGYSKIVKNISINENQSYKEVLVSESGYISLTSSPDHARVAIDQQVVGSTPLVNTEIKPGIHTIQVAHDCFHETQFSLQVSAGQKLTRHIELSQNFVPLDITLSEPASIGDVYIDGQLLGRTPFSGSVSVCSKQVIISLEGKTYTKPLQLHNNKNAIQITVPKKVEPPSYNSMESPQSFRPELFAYSKESDTLVVATGTKYEPMFDITGQIPIGIDIEIAQELGRRLGKKNVRFVKSSSARIAATNEEVDFAIAAISITDERQKIHLFSIPYFETGQVVVMQNVGQNGYGDLSTKICGYHSPLYKSILKKHTCSLKQYSSSTAVMNALRNNEIDYTILEDQSVPIEFWKSSIISRDSYGIVFPNGFYELKMEVDRHLRDMETSGYIEQLKSKYNLN